MKVVLDTNILISGIARRGGTPGRMVEAWLQGKFDLIVSEPLIEELSRALRYPKVRKLLLKAQVSDDEVQEFLDILRMKTLVIDVSKAHLPVLPSDPEDSHVLKALVASGADYLVTGDRRGLLSLGISQIVTAAEFVSRVMAFETLAPQADPGAKES